MSKLLFNLPTPTVPIFTRNTAKATGESASKWIHAQELFPVRRIYCVGRNYREHTIEMGGNPDREAPFFFMKPNDAIVNCSPSSIELGASDGFREKTTASVPYPTQTSSLHHEAELIIAIGKDGLRIPTSKAMEYVYGYSLGCDLTRRDLQSAAKTKGRPWDSAKGFDYSCPLGGIIPKEEVDLNDETELVLKVNNKIRQQSSIGSMIYSIPEVISHLSQLFWLRQGDLIMTGTPAGVSDLNVGDCVEITCGDLLPCKFEVGLAEE